MCGGGGISLPDPTDILDPIISTGEDILGGAGDVVSGALDTAGDIVDTAVQTVADNPELATIVAIALGQPELIGADAFTAEELASAAEAAAGTEYGTETAAALNEAGTVASGVDSIPLDAFDGPTLPTDLPFDGPTNPIDNPFDGPTNPTDNPFNNPTNPTDNPFDGPTTPTGIPENIPTNPIDFSKYYKIPLDLAKTILSGGASGVKKFLSGVGSLSNIDSGDMKDFFTNLGSAAPLLGAAGLGYLTYKGRKGTNQTIMDTYNNNLAKQSGINTAYGVAQGPQTLNYNVAGIPLAQAQPRTAEQTVVMPKAARGGSINDLYNEYSELNNRMRNYRRLAKGGLI